MAPWIRRVEAIDRSDPIAKGYALFMLSIFPH